MFSWKPWLVVATASLFFSYELIQMHMFSAINTSIMIDFNLDAADLGRLSAIYLWANVIFLFPAGVILDRVSVKAVIQVAMLLCILGTILFASFDAYWLLFFSRFVTGIGSAFCVLSCLRIATRWFPSSKMALVTGVIVTIGMLGGVFAQTPLTWMTKVYGWRNAVYIDAGIGVLLMIMIFLFVENNAPSFKLNKKDDVNTLSINRLWETIRKCYFNKQTILAALYTSTMNMTVMVLGAVFGTLYLSQVYNIGELTAAGINTMIFIGMIVGGPLVGWFSDKISRRRVPMLMGSVLSFVAILILVLCADLSMGSLYVLFFALGFFSSAQVISYPLVAESNSILLTATAVSVVSVITQGGGAFYQELFGRLLQSNWDGRVEGKVKIYSLANYNDALMLLIVGSLISLIAAFFIKETYGKQSAKV